MFVALEVIHQQILVLHIPMSVQANFLVHIPMFLVVYTPHILGSYPQIAWSKISPMSPCLSVK